MIKLFLCPDGKRALVKYVLDCDETMLLRERTAFRIRLFAAQTSFGLIFGKKVSARDTPS